MIINNKLPEKEKHRENSWFDFPINGEEKEQDVPGQSQRIKYHFHAYGF